MATINIGTLEAIIRLNDQMSPAMKKMVAQFKDAAKAMAILTTAAYTANKALEAQAAQEASINKLNLALANQGNLTESTSQSLIAYSEALQQNSTFADDVILAQEAMLASFGLSEEQIIRTTQAAADYAAATGTDLETATMMLGKASTGTVTALQKLGFEFDKGGTDAEKFESALSQVEQRFGGSALAATKTYTGQLEQLKNGFDNVMEGLGKFIGELANLGTAGGGAAGLMQMLANFFGVTLVKALYEARAAFSEFLAVMLSGLANIAAVMDKVFGTNDAPGLKNMAADQRAFAVQLRAQGEAAAAAAGNLQTYTNSVGGTSHVNDEAAAAAKKHADEIQRLAESLSGADLEQELANIAEAVASGIELTDKAMEGIADKVGEAMEEGLVIPASLIPIQQQVIAKQLQEIVDGAFARLEVKKGTGEDLWKKLLGEGLSGGIMAGPAGKIIQEEIDRAVAGQDAIEAGIRANEAATFDWAQQLENIANMAATLPGFFGKALSTILSGVASIGASLKNIGGVGGLLKNLTGGGGLGGIFAGAGVVGSIVGGVVGIFKGIFGDSKKKAEELKKKQDEAVKSWVSLFEQWQQMRSELANKGADAINTMIGTLFDEDGKFTAEFTSAANAATYVAAQFNVLRASGLSVAQALAKMGPALDAMGKDAKKFGGTVAAPLIQMAKFASENEKLLAFTESLGQTAIALASFGQFTQEIANMMSGDLVNSINKMIGKGLSYEQALGLSAQTLFDLEQAAKNSGVALSAQAQKMIDDARSQGLFEGLQDPMQKLIELQGAMVAAMGQLITLMGGAVPAAIQRMIDEFNNAQINVSVNVDVGTNNNGPGPNNQVPPELPNKQIPNFQHGSDGVRNFGAGTLAMLHGREAVVREDDLGGTVNLYITTLPHQDAREIAEYANREIRNNRRGRLTQNKKGRR